ncbi:hypothetical protein [Microtetraspora sp. NBRC 16547]|uniref:hypothetical protein n=1 Tax=Microtetraspora sp. NBRC 16547 TaxID=3030993 RepID=UPI0024A19C7A|nr:hypothetical protein [Microtetraspora sp. NBRC 16547]GLW98784.1 hypothetical protein Misp02_28710 [Microtetraspora sp. NBRC 16547]
MRIEVTEAHLRGLNDHGPGWTLMWDGTDILIGPTSAADDGTLLKIVSYGMLAELGDIQRRSG